MPQLFFFLFSQFLETFNTENFLKKTLFFPHPSLFLYYIVNSFLFRFLTLYSDHTAAFHVRSLHSIPHKSASHYDCSCSPHMPHTYKYIFETSRIIYFRVLMFMCVIITAAKKRTANDIYTKGIFFFSQFYTRQI